MKMVDPGAAADMLRERATRSGEVLPAHGVIVDDEAEGLAGLFHGSTPDFLRDACDCVGDFFRIAVRFAGGGEFRPRPARRQQPDQSTCSANAIASISKPSPSQRRRCSRVAHVAVCVILLPGKPMEPYAGDCGCGRPLSE